MDIRLVSCFVSIYLFLSSCLPSVKYSNLITKGFIYGYVEVNDQIQNFNLSEKLRLAIRSTLIQEVNKH